MALIPNATTMPRGIIGTWANMEEDNARTGVASVEFASAIPLQRATGDQEVAPLTTGNVFVGVALRTVDMLGTRCDALLNITNDSAVDGHSAYVARLTRNNKEA